MIVKPETPEESLALCLNNMPYNSTLEYVDSSGVVNEVKWRVARTMINVWTLYMKGAAERARELKHVKPHANTQWYETGELAAMAIMQGHHTAYGQLVGEPEPAEPNADPNQKLYVQQDKRIGG